MRRLLLLAAWLAAAAGLPAFAQDASNGANLYKATLVAGKRSCSNSACHGGLPTGAQNHIGNGIDAARIQAIIGTQEQMAFLAGQLTNAQLNDLAAYIAQQMGGSPNYLPLPPTARPQISPAGINFGTQALAIATPAQSFTFGNAASATAPLVLGTIGMAGSDFAVAGGSCSSGLTLAAGASCTVAVTFRPTLAGTRSGTLTVAHDGPGGATLATLSGIGGDTAPVASVSPGQLTFAQTVGAASAVQRVVVSNTGEAPLVFSGIAIGGSEAGEFALGAGSTCVTGGTVAVGANCSVEVSFTPAAAGSRSATLTLQHNAGTGRSTVALVGTGNPAAAPNLTLDALSLDLGTQALGVAGPARTLTVGNNGSAPLVFTALTVSGLNSADIVAGGSCSTAAPVPVGGSCSVTLSLKPSALGTRSAQLVISSNTPTGSASVTLVGEAIATPAPFVQLAPVALGFGRVTLGTASVQRSSTLTNNGSAALVLGSLSSSSSEFALSHDCPASLPAGASCRIGVTYTPAAATAAERVSITSNAFSSPNSVVLTGQGTSDTLPVLAWSATPADLVFDATEVGQASATRTLTLVNQGPGEAAVSAFALVGSAPAAFTLDGSGSCGGAVRLAAGASCTVVLAFVPDLAGSRTATLMVASNGSNPPEVALAGTGIASAGSGDGGGGGGGTGGGGGSGGGATSPFATDRGSMDFRSTVVRTGSRSDPMTLRISNRTAAAATITALTTSADFLVEPSPAADACRGVPWTLAPGASCTVVVVFAPGSGGSATGKLSITAADTSVLEVPLQADARTEVTNTGGGGAVEPWWALALALSLPLLARRNRSTPEDRS